MKLDLIVDNPKIGKIYESQAVFELCKAQLKTRITEVMYMHSDNETTHYFKDINTRKYLRIIVK